MLGCLVYLPSRKRLWSFFESTYQSWCWIILTSKRCLCLLSILNHCKSKIIWQTNPSGLDFTVVSKLAHNEPFLLLFVSYSCKKISAQYKLMCWVYFRNYESWPSSSSHIFLNLSIFSWTYFMIAQILFKFLTLCKGDYQQYYGWRKLVQNNQAQRSDDTMKRYKASIFSEDERWLVCKKRQ